MLAFLKKDNPLMLPLLFIATAAMWLGDIISPHFHSGVFEQMPMPLYQVVLMAFSQASWWATTIAAILLLFTGFVLNQLNARFRLIDEGTYLPGVLFVLIISSFHSIHQINPMLFAIFFLLIALHIVFPTYRIEKTIEPFFNSAFLISVGSLFYFPLIFFVLILFYFMLNSRSFYWREWVVALLGIITPYLFAFSIYFIIDKPLELLNTLQYQLSVPATNDTIDVRYIVFFFFISIMMFSSIFYLRSNVIKKVVTRKYFGIITFIWILSLVLFILLDSVYIESIYLFAIPFSFILSNYLIKNRSKVGEDLIFIGLILLLLIVSFA